MVNTHTVGWRMCEMLAPGLSSRDASWFARWCRSLDAASACLVVFTPNYLASANLTEHSNLRLEAAMIQKRLRRLHQRRLYRRNSFRLFVLDPYQVGQDYANLKLYLEHGEASLNVEEWLSFINAGATPTLPAPPDADQPQVSRATERSGSETIETSAASESSPDVADSMGVRIPPDDGDDEPPDPLAMTRRP